jgi:VanZ family protein
LKEQNLSGSEPWRNPRPAPPLDELRARVPPESMIPSWLRAWWPAILWGIVIFFASTDTFSSAHTGSILWAVLHWLFPLMNEDQFDYIHFITRKSAHLTEYFIFYLLLFRGMRGERKGWYWTWAFGAWFIAAFYSALDEIHQSFVASRTASPWDSLIDSTGAFLALIVVFLYFRIYRRNRPA